MDTDKPIVFIVDRPALDGMAYVGRHEFLQVLEELALDLHEQRERYKAIIYCETAAAREGYTTENNLARSESALQALELDQKTWEAWLGHQHLIRIPAQEDFETKKLLFLKSLSRVLHMPEPYEIERKYRLDNFRSNMIPGNARAVEIVQTYLSSDVGSERRVRMRTVDGSSSYYFTEKHPTYSSAKRIERERQIERSEYETLLKEARPDMATIYKIRHSFEFGGRTIELDIYRDIKDLVVVEVEIPSLDEVVRLPEGWDCVEVTNDKDYKNAGIAKLLYLGTAGKLFRPSALNPQA
ncbi:MAG: hypothetical protein JWN50_780 [Parcubacteria group bacterium]|nr:hypothetical protein [Parcubacteria group bacterium]